MLLKTGIWKTRLSLKWFGSTSWFKARPVAFTNWKGKIVWMYFIIIIIIIIIIVVVVVVAVIVDDVVDINTACEDVKESGRFCSRFKHFCSSGNYENVEYMKKMCPYTCGYCSWVWYGWSWSLFGIHRVYRYQSSPYAINVNELFGTDNKWIDHINRKLSMLKCKVFLTYL